MNRYGRFIDAIRCCWVAVLGVLVLAGCTPPKKGGDAEVIHWWTSGGESAAVRELASAYRQAGGVWIDSPVALGEQARAVTLSRIAGGNPPTAAQFNTSRQFHELAEQGMLANLDELAREQQWERNLPSVVREAVRVDGHYYAAPVSIHMLTWFWYSKAALRKAGIEKEPANFAEFVQHLELLKKSGVVPLAFGGQPWQESILFTAVLGNVGGRDLYLAVFRDHRRDAIASTAFAEVLRQFSALRAYTDAGAVGRNWNDATAMVVRGEAGFQVMGDWAKGEYAAAGKAPGRDYGCLPGLGEGAPYIVQGDVFIFPKSAEPQQSAAQQLLARVVTAPATQLAFSRQKGSLPIRTDISSEQLDDCAQVGARLVVDPERQAGNGEMYMTPDQNGAMSDIITELWSGALSVPEAQRRFGDAVGR